MVPYSDLIQIGILIVGIIGLFVQVKKVIAGTLRKYGDHMLNLMG